MSKFRKCLYGVRRRSRGKGGEDYTSGNVYSPGIRMTGIIGGVIGSVKWGAISVETWHCW